MFDGFIDDWFLASWSVKGYYWFLLVVSLWTAARANALARALIAGGERLERIDADIGQYTAMASAHLGVLRGLIWLTVVVSFCSVATDLVPALLGEATFNISAEQVWFRVLSRLTARLSMGLSVAAFITIVVMVFENVLSRRLAAALGRRSTRCAAGAPD